jgi:hypothetical protein
MRPGEQQLRRGEWADAGFVDELRSEFERQGLDLRLKFALFGSQLLDAPRESAQRLQRAAQLDVAVAARPDRGQAFEQPAAGERPQFAAQRFGCGDDQVAQLAETGSAGVDSTVTCGHQRSERLALPARARPRRPLLRKHDTRGPDRVERVGLPAGAAFPPQPADLEHLLAPPGQEAGEAGTEGATALDREGTPTGSVLRCELEGTPVAARARCDRRLEHNTARSYLDDRDRVHITMRIDADHVVQLICKHPYRPPATGWGSQPEPVWGWKPRAAEL